MSKQLQQALAFHKLGNVNEAARLYDLVIKQNPEQHQAKYLLAIINVGLNKIDEAFNLLTSAVNLNPCYEYCNALGELLYKAGKPENALFYLNEALKFQQNDYLLMFKMANILYEFKQPENAIAFLNEALILNPNFDEAYYSLGVIYYESNNIEKAIYSYKKSVEINSNNSKACLNIGVIYSKQNNDDEALNYYFKAEESGLKVPLLYSNIARSLYNTKNYTSALEYVDKAISLDAYSGSTYNLKGIILHKLDKLNLAEECYLKAISCNLNDCNIYNNLAQLYKDKNDIEKAIEYFNKGLKHSPNAPECRYNLCTLNFLQGNYKGNWADYNYRFHIKDDRITKVNLNKPKLDNKAIIKDKTIYIYFEQGFGDTIMFSRYILKLIENGARIFFRPQNSLINLFKESELFYHPNIAITDCILDKPDFEYDYHMSVMDMPEYFDICPETAPYKSGYLSSNSNKVNLYKEKYFNNNLLKVGVFWQGNPDGLKNRAIQLNKMINLFKNKNIQFYSLQKGLGIEQLSELDPSLNIIDLGSTFTDFTDTAAALENIDIMITIDTSIAHLSSALGKQTYLMLPFAPEWRWGLNSESSSWYDNITLFRQKKSNNWDDVINAIKQKLI